MARGKNVMVKRKHVYLRLLDGGEKRFDVRGRNRESFKRETKTFDTHAAAVAYADIHFPAQEHIVGRQDAQKLVSSNDAVTDRKPQVYRYVTWHCHWQKWVVQNDKVTRRTLYFDKNQHRSPDVIAHRGYALPAPERPDT